jgi:hypothetical protein
MCEKNIRCLVKYYRDVHFQPGDNLLKPNEFVKVRDGGATTHASLDGYMLSKSIPFALAQARNVQDETPAIVLDLLLTLLNSNNNSKSYYSDNFYLSTLLRALGHTRAVTPEHQQGIAAQFRRYLELDSVLPSYHNLLTQAVLESLCRLQLQKQVVAPPFGQFDFVPYMGTAYHEEVRLTAFRCLVAKQVDAPLQEAHTVWSLLAVLEQEGSLNVVEHTSFADGWNLTPTAMTLDWKVGSVPRPAELMQNQVL